MNQMKTVCQLENISTPSAKSKKDYPVSVRDLLAIHDWLKANNRLCSCGRLVSHTNTWGAWYCKKCCPVSPSQGERTIKVTPNAIERCLYRTLRSGIKKLNQAAKERKEPEPTASEPCDRPAQSVHSIDVDPFKLPRRPWWDGGVQGSVAAAGAQNSGGLVCNW